MHFASLKMAFIIRRSHHTAHLKAALLAILFRQILWMCALWCEICRVARQWWWWLHTYLAQLLRALKFVCTFFVCLSHAYSLQFRVWSKRAVVSCFLCKLMFFFCCQFRAYATCIIKIFELNIWCCSSWMTKTLISYKLSLVWNMQNFLDENEKSMESFV